MIGSLADAGLALARKPSASIQQQWPESMRFVATAAGNLRVLDSEPGNRSKPVIVFVPDGPNVIEHYQPLMALLAGDFRVLCFDMPGFGFSYPSPRYNFQLGRTADAVIAVLDALNVEQAILGFSCANGFFALHTAQKYPQRVSHLILSQTPAFSGMRAWTERIVPGPVRTPVVGQLLMAATAKKFAKGWYDIALAKNSEQKPWFQRHATHAVNNGGCFCLASLSQGLLKANDALLAINRTPTLMIYGDMDHSHKHTDFSAFAEHAPHAKIKRFGGCTHFPDVERPDAYAKELRGFVA